MRPAGTVQPVRAGGPHLRGKTQEHHRLQRALPATAASARLARVSARVACRAWRVPDAGDTAVVVASELVNIALRSPAQDRLTLRVLMTPRRLRLEVEGASARRPLQAAVGSAPAAGAAVDLLGGLCVRWGVVEASAAEPAGGWAEVALVDGRPSDVWETGAAAPSSP